MVRAWAVFDPRSANCGTGVRRLELERPLGWLLPEESRPEASRWLQAKVLFGLMPALLYDRLQYSAIVESNSFAPFCSQPDCRAGGVRLNGLIHHSSYSGI